MAVFCHRCGGELAAAGGESSFCQHCGAPQLRVLEENVATNPPAKPGATSQVAENPHSGKLIWTTIVGYAAAVAGVSALLTFGVLWLPAGFPLAWLWTVCGGVVVLGLYQRKHPTSYMSARLGARIGLVYGLLATMVLSLVLVSIGLVARFSMHTMSTLDALLSNAMRQAAEQQAAQPGAVALSADQIRNFYSPEVRAGLAIFLLTVAAGFLVAFSAVGGAVGGMMRMRRFDRPRTDGN